VAHEIDLVEIDLVAEADEARSPKPVLLATPSASVPTEPLW